MNTWDDVVAPLGCLGLLVAAVIGSLLLLGFAVEATFEGDSAQIESLRTDAAVVSADVGEDVIGQVTQWNQSIATNQYVNSLPVIGFFMSDRWEMVEPIEVPQ